MDYRTLGLNGEFFVVDGNDQIVSKAYDAEHKAKRRIRDLKRKAEAATSPDDAVVPQSAIPVPVAPAAIVVTISRPVGCYPFVQKKHYRRRWAA